MRKPMLSIIVPVYNVEKYLSRCIESILAQTFMDYELVLVNDGSTDNCSSICDEYERKDHRIKVIHKENGGLSDARNTGIYMAKGKYIAFVDSDDFIINSAYAVLISQAEKNNLDIITGNAIKFISENDQRPKKKKRSFGNEIMSGLELLKRSYSEKAMLPCSTLSIYRNQLIKKNKIWFKKDIFHEDNLWTPQIFLKARRTMYYDIDFYMHFNREKSITNQEDKSKNGLDLLSICYELAEAYKEIQDEKAKKVLNDNLSSSYLRAVCIGKLQRKKFAKNIKREFPLEKSYNIRNKIKSIFFYISPKLYVKIFYRFYL